MGSFREKNRRLRHIAKEVGASKEVVLQEMRAYAKSRIKSPEKVLHFHKTSIDNLKDIVELGGLLSRPEVKKRKPDKKLPGWSASEDVMMTQDKYNDDGALRQRGLTSHGVGASGRGVVMVMGPQIMDLPDYDAICDYPTVSDAPLAKNCDAILVDGDEDRAEVEKLLAQGGIKNIAVRFRDEWEREHYDSKK